MFYIKQPIIMNTHSIKLSVYNDTSLDMCNYKNNRPLIYFDTPELAYDFIKNLKSTPKCSMKESYFCINDTHLLPDDVRKSHMFKKYVTYNDDDSDNERDDDGVYILCDGCFSMSDNAYLFTNCAINDNTNEKIGFSAFVKSLNSKYNFYYYSEEYYNSKEYEDDMRDEYHDSLKYNRQDDSD